MVSWYASHSETYRWTEKVGVLQIPPTDDICQLMEYVLCGHSLFPHPRHRSRAWTITTRANVDHPLLPFASPVPPRPRKSRGGPYQSSGTNSGWTSRGSDRFPFSSTRRGRSVLQLLRIRDGKLNPPTVSGDEHDRFNILRLHPFV